MMRRRSASVLKRCEVLDSDLKRLVGSMRALLRRRYPDPAERQIAAQQIMREVKA